MKIFKYSFGAFGNNFKNDWFKVTLPKNFKPLSFQLQLAPFHPDDGSLEMWALIDEDEEEKEFDFICVGTGIEFDSKEAVYIGTAQDRPYVWHLFYKKETP